MTAKEIFSILAGWVILVLTVIGALTDASETMVMGGFIFALQAFMYSDIEEIKAMIQGKDNENR